MIDKPIIMSTESVRAILDGKKTMTRRIIKPQPLAGQDICPVPVDLRDFPETWAVREMADKPVDVVRYIKCPYGQVGQRLWVRESWFDNSFYPEDRDNVLYRADGEFKEQIPEEYDGAKWRPSIFMPRWASRITLEITGVRVEKLQDISDEDIKAEGLIGYAGLDSILEATSTTLLRFQVLWDKINTKRDYGWNTNPWCWVISFREEQKDE